MKETIEKKSYCDHHNMFIRELSTYYNCPVIVEDAEFNPTKTLRSRYGLMDGKKLKSKSESRRLLLLS